MNKRDKTVAHSWLSRIDVNFKRGGITAAFFAVIGLVFQVLCLSSHHRDFYRVLCFPGEYIRSLFMTQIQIGHDGIIFIYLLLTNAVPYGVVGLVIGLFANKPATIKQRYHPFTFVAFLLAFFVLIVPVQEDLVFEALNRKLFIRAVTIVIFSLAMVLVPLIYAQVQTRKQPERWKPRVLTQLTWGIVILNVVFNVMMLTKPVNRRTSSLIRHSNSFLR